MNGLDLNKWNIFRNKYFYWNKETTRKWLQFTNLLKFYFWFIALLKTKSMRELLGNPFFVEVVIEAFFMTPYKFQALQPITRSTNESIPDRILMSSFATIIFKAHKRSLGQGNIFRSVCQEFCSQRGGGAIPACIAGGSGIPACLAAGLGGVSQYAFRGVCSGGCLLRGCGDPAVMTTATGGTHPTGMHSCWFKHQLNFYVDRCISIKLFAEGAIKRRFVEMFTELIINDIQHLSSSASTERCLWLIASK